MRDVNWYQADLKWMLLPHSKPLSSRYTQQRRYLPSSIFVAFHSPLLASSIHAHSVKPTCSRIYCTNAFAPGVPSLIARAPTWGMCRADARRASLDGGRVMRRVDVLEGFGFERWMRVGMWACGREEGGWTWGIITRARGWREDLVQGTFSSTSLFPPLLDLTKVEGAYCAASASKWRVTLLRPIKM